MLGDAGSLFRRNTALKTSANTVSSHVSASHLINCFITYVKHFALSLNGTVQINSPCLIK